MKKNIIILITFFLCCKLISQEDVKEPIAKNQNITPDVMAKFIGDNDLMKEVMAYYDSNDKAKQELLSQTIASIEKMKGTWKDIVPQKVRISNSFNSNKTLTQFAFGYQFDIPWKPSKVNQENNEVIKYYFTKKRFLMLINPEKNWYDTKIMKNKLYATFINRYIKKENKESQYTFWKNCLNTTAKDVNLESIDKLEDINEIFIFLVIKKIAVFNSSKIYQFSLGDIKGFQFGVPGKDKWVYFYLFDDSNKLIELFLASPNNCESISQGDINTILKSLKKKANQKDALNSDSAVAKPE